MAGPEDEAAQLARMVAGGVMRDLQLFYPLEDPKHLEQIAIGTGIDQVGQLGPMFNALRDTRITHIGMRLIKPSRLAGGKDQEIAFKAPRDIASCSTLNETMTAATVYALVLSPSARALLSKNGYRCAFFAHGDHLPAEGAEVVRIDFKKRRKGDGPGPNKAG